jgi:Domain of Unknown Function (DUF1206)
MSTHVSPERAVQSPGFEWFARAGFVARGVIYVLIGILAVKLALGAGGHAASQQGAFHEIAGQPFGKVLLVLTAIGLAGYAVWRLTRAALGHGPEGSDSTADRIVALASGVVYAALCVLAIQILLGAGGGSSGAPKKATAGVLGWPAGVWLVGIAGAVMIGVGLFQGYKGLTKDFLEDSKTEKMSHAARKSIEWIATFGYLARMVVFVLVGGFLIQAAINYEPSKAVGLDGALARLAQHSYGPFLLGVVAAGLIAFGLYSLTDARYRRI